VLRITVASDFEEVTLTARAAFSKRSWPFVLATCIPWLLRSGQRSVRSLAAMKVLERSASAYYRFLSEGKLRLGVLFRCLFELIVKTFGVEDLTLVLDDTLCPKWGRQIYGTASYFDHVRRPRPGFIWGHNWVVIAVVIRASSKASIALPFWISLYRPKDKCSAGEFRTRHEMAAGALFLVRSLFPGKIRLLADGAYANRSLARPAQELGIQLVSRLRKDASLRAATPPRRAKGTRGRKPKYGRRLAKLASLARSKSCFRKQRVSIYGKQVELLVRTFDAYWPALRQTIRVVITRDPKRPKRLAFLFSTDMEMKTAEVIESFAQRWTIEQLFSVAKIQMGLGSAEVRKRRSVVRHATMCMALITWTEVWAYRRKPSKWARSFTQKLASLRRETIKSTVFDSGPRTRGSARIAKGMADLFVRATCAA